MAFSVMGEQMDPEEFRTRYTRGSRGGSGPDRSEGWYTGPGHQPRSGTSRMPKPVRVIKGITNAIGQCLYCTHKKACKCQCPCNTAKAALCDEPFPRKGVG